MEGYRINTPVPVYFIAAGIISGFALAYTLTGFVRKYAIHINMLDTPNARTLHQGLVPRGGGLSIVITMLLALFLLWLAWPLPVVPYLFATVLILGVLGWLDDRLGLNPFVKMGVQLAVALIVVTYIGILHEVEIAGYLFSFGAAAAILTVLWLVGLTNVYNFMDGIDGIAASYTAVIAGVMGIWFVTDQNSALALFCYVIMAAALGFLIWNWMPARIFMGDVGSVTLGGVFAVLAIIGHNSHDVPITAYMTLLGVFLFDTVVTILRRLFQGKAIWQPHREHFYQRAVAMGFSHAQVTVAVVIITLILAALASLEKFRVGPIGLWPVLALILLTSTALAIHVVEKKQC